MTLATVDLLGATPHTPTPQECVYCLEALSHLLHGDIVAAFDFASRLSPAARHELLICLAQLAGMVTEVAQRDVATAALTPDALPDALPDGVEGIPIGGRHDG